MGCKGDSQPLGFMYTEMRYRRVGLTQVQLSRRIPEHFFATLMSINWAPVVKPAKGTTVKLEKCVCGDGDCVG